MQKMRTYLARLFVATMVCGQAMSQPTNDASSDHDARAMQAHAGHEANPIANGKFELVSPDGKYRIGLRGLLQENNKFTYMPGNKKTNIDIELKRARVALHGSALDPRLTFLVQTALEKEPSALTPGYSAPGTDYLSDYYLNLAFAHKFFQLRAGKFTTPFSRQQMAPAALHQFYDTSAANNKFRITSTGKDVGIMLHNSAHFPFEWAIAGVKNGVVARIGFNQNSIDGYEFVDFNGGDIRFGIAANGFVHTDYKSTKLDDIRGGADFIAKVAGFSTNGAFYYQRDKTKANVQNNFGTSIDAGYLIVHHIEPVVRHSWIYRNQTTHEQELLGGLNYYIHNHNLKVQAYGGVELLGKQISKGIGGLQIQLAI